MTQQLKVQRQKNLSQAHLYIGALLLILLLLSLLSLMVGSTFYGINVVFRVLMGEEIPGASFAIGEVRFPRVIMGILAGLAFGASGITFQTLLRNQLASPDIIGVSAGASAAGVTGIVIFHWGQWQTSVFALVISLLVTLIIYALSIKNGFAGTRLILIGIGVASLLQAVTTYVLSQAATWDLRTAMQWLSGSLHSAQWQRIIPLACFVLIFVPILALLAHQIGLLELGDDLATSLGVPVSLVRVLSIICATILIAVATAACGPIAFVAFMSGPIAARLFQPGTPLVIPSALVGAILVVASDFIAQHAFNTNYPVGVITGCLGAPFLIYLLISTNKKD